MYINYIYISITPRRYTQSSWIWENCIQYENIYSCYYLDSALRSKGLIKLWLVACCTFLLSLRYNLPWGKFIIYSIVTIAKTIFANVIREHTYYILPRDKIRISIILKDYLSLLDIIIWVLIFNDSKNHTNIRCKCKSIANALLSTKLHYINVKFKCM